MTDDRAVKVRAREIVGSGEREIEFYLILNASGCGHMAGGAAEVQHVALSTGRIVANLTIGTGLDAATSHIR